MERSRRNRSIEALRFFELTLPRCGFVKRRVGEAATLGELWYEIVENDTTPLDLEHGEQGAGACGECRRARRIAHCLPHEFVEMSDGHGDRGVREEIPDHLRRIVPAGILEV